MGFISESRIEKIESEKVTVQPEDVVAMAEAYKNPGLCNYYCSHECRIGQDYVPEVKLTSLAEISLGILASTILMFVNVSLGLIMFALTSILNVVYSYHGLKFLGTKDENKYGYIYLLTNVLFYVVIFIISKIFS